MSPALRPSSTNTRLRSAALGLYGQLFSLLSLFKAPMRRAKLDVTLFRLETLEVARQELGGQAEVIASDASKAEA